MVTIQFFIFFRKSSLGQRVSTSTISRCLWRCIILAYKATDLVPTEGIIAHFLREMATSADYTAFPFLETICKAATLESIHSFMRHYHMIGGLLLKLHLRAGPITDSLSLAIVLSFFPSLFYCFVLTQTWGWLHDQGHQTMEDFFTYHKAPFSVVEEWSSPAHPTGGDDNTHTHQKNETCIPVVGNPWVITQL